LSRVLSQASLLGERLIMASLTIINPTEGENEPPSFVADGTVGAGASVEVTLQSSLSTVPPVVQQATPVSGVWSSSFSVDANNYPGESTLTAKIVGTTTGISVTFQIVGT
jgi:hypothetical protein